MANSKILVIDDEKPVVELHRKLLENEGYDVIVAYNGLEALGKVFTEEPDLILTDVSMPKMDGLELCEQLKNGEHTNLVPIIMVTALDDFDYKVRGKEIGADDFLVKPIRPRELYARVRSLLRIKGLTDCLESAETVIFSLANAIEAKDEYAKGHIHRVSPCAAALGKFIGLDHDDINNLQKGGMLHDIGKIGIRDSILYKPGKLTAEEFEEVKKHPCIGEKICYPLQTLRPVLPIIKHHHEKYDGSGYPSGLVGENIPILARITAIVDVYDALTSRRAYRDAMPHKKAMKILSEETADNKFDPLLFEKFQELIKTDKDSRKKTGRI